MCMLLFFVSNHFLNKGILPFLLFNQGLLNHIFSRAIGFYIKLTDISWCETNTNNDQQNSMQWILFACQLIFDVTDSISIQRQKLHRGLFELIHIENYIVMHSNLINVRRIYYFAIYNAILLQKWTIANILTNSDAHIYFTAITT